MFKTKKKNENMAELAFRREVERSANLEELGLVFQKHWPENITCWNGRELDAVIMYHAIRSFTPESASAITRSYGLRQQCYMLWHHEEYKKAQLERYQASV